jgi:hypothetical protein
MKKRASRRGSTKKNSARGPLTEVAKPKAGISLEQAVARIQSLLDPKSQVTHSEILVDRIGNRRQFDVVVRGTFAGHAVLAVVECKDHARKKNPDAVEAFAKKCENLRADLKIMVSRLGFTKQALKVAAHENIRCLSLLASDEGQTGLKLRATCYARIWSWTNIRFALVPDYPGIVRCAADKVLFGGKPVLELFDNDLETNFPAYTTVGPVKRIIEFDAPAVLSICGHSVEATAVRFAAERVCTYRKKEVQYSGDGAYDWQKKEWTVPDKAEIVSKGWKADFSQWDEIDASTIAAGGPFQWVLDVFLPPRTPLCAVSEYDLRVVATQPVRAVVPFAPPTDAAESS